MAVTTTVNTLDYSSLIVTPQQTGDDSSSEKTSSSKSGTSTTRISPYSIKDGTTSNLSLTTTGDEKASFVSLASTTDTSTEDPTAPIQDTIDLLFNSDFMTEINEGFMYGLKQKDKSFESLDVLRNPQNYTPEQKLIMYLDLLQTQSTYHQYVDHLGDNERGTNNGDEVNGDLNNAIAILGADPDVKAQMTEKVLKAYKLIFEGYRVSPADTDQDVMTLMDQTMTRDNNMKALRQKILDAYQKDVVQGGILDEGLAAGKDINTISQEYNTALSFYSMVLPDDMVKAGASAAAKKYAEFFDKNIITHMSDAKETLDGLINEGLGTGLTDNQKLGLGSIIPVLDSSLVKQGGDVFGDLHIDLSALQKVAESDVNYKDGDGVSRLFDASVEAMAEQWYGTGADKAKDREHFKQDVLNRLEPLLEKAASGEMSLADLAGNLERAVSGLKSLGGDVNGYQNLVQTALQGLLLGASLVSKVPTNETDGMARVMRATGNLSTYSVNDVITMLTEATGLAGQGMAASGGSSPFFIGSTASAGIAKTMFGVDNKAWSKTVSNLNLSYLDKDLLQSSLKSTSQTISNLVKTLLGDTNIIDPIVITTADEKAALDKIIAPSADALANTYFANNADAIAQYKSNFTTIFAAMWGLLKPGGSVDSIKAQISKLIDQTVTSAPAGVDSAKYKETLLSGVTTVLNASRAIYAGLNMTNPTWDSIGLVIIHSVSALATTAAALGDAVKSSNLSFIGSLTGSAGELAVAENKVITAFFKNTGTIAGGIAAVGWLPVEYYQFLKAIDQGGGDPVDLIFMGIGTAADTVGAFEGITGVAYMLANSTFLGRTGAAIGLATGVFSTVFAVAGAVSWAAWAGLAIYQSIKQEKEFKKQTDNINEMLSRTVNDTVNLYIKSSPTGRIYIPPKIEEVVTTPDDWDAIKASAEANRRSETGA